MLSGFILLVLLLFTPKLLVYLWSSIRYKHSGSIQLYVARLLPYWLFALMLILSKALMLSVIALSWLTQANILPKTLGWGQIMSFIGVGVILVSLFELFQYLGHRYWAYLFMSRHVSKRLQHEFASVSVAFTCLLAPVAWMSLLPIESSVLLYILLALLSLRILLRIVQVLRCLLNSSYSNVYVFLYLCAQELLPWCYIALVLRYLHRGL